VAEVLSQDEIDELMAAVNSGEIAVDRKQAKKRKDAGRLRAYDFRRPDRFSKEQIRTLEMMHEGLARRLTSSFSGYFRTSVKVEIEDVSQMMYEEYVDAVGNPAVLAIASLEPLTGNSIVEIHLAIAFPIIDRLLGGPGYAPPEDRALTEIEQAVIEHVVQGFLADFAESWRNVVEVRPRLEGIETNPLFVQGLAENEMVVTVSFKVSIGDAVGKMRLCLPYLVLEPVLPNLSAQQWFASGSSGGVKSGREALAGHLRAVPVGVRVLLGSANLEVNELLDLTIGDVVRLEQRVASPLHVVVGGRPKFLAWPGRLGREVAIEIAEVISQGGEGCDGCEERAGDEGEGEERGQRQGAEQEPDREEG